MGIRFQQVNAQATRIFMGTILNEELHPAFARLMIELNVRAGTAHVLAAVDPETGEPYAADWPGAAADRRNGKSAPQPGPHGRASPSPGRSCADRWSRSCGASPSRK